MEVRRSTQRPARRGFSLVEVMVALVVVAFGLYGLLDLIAANERNSLLAQRRAVAVELARGKMAELHALGFDAVRSAIPQALDQTTTGVLYPEQPAEFSLPYQTERFFWQARIDAADTEAQAVNVELRVYWYPTAEAPIETLREHSVSVGGFLVREARAQ